MGYHYHQQQPFERAQVEPGILFVVVRLGDVTVKEFEWSEGEECFVEAEEWVLIQALRGSVKDLIETEMAAVDADVYEEQGCAVVVCVHRNLTETTCDHVLDYSDSGAPSVTAEPVL